MSIKLMTSIKLFISAFLMLTILKSSSFESVQSVISNNPEGQILFISRRVPESADWKMILMNTDGSDQREFTSKRVRCSKPVTSSNGQFIAFTTYENKDYHLYVVRTDGQNLTLLSVGEQYCGNPSFSPDNSKIVFSKTESYPDYSSDIYIVDIDGKNEIKLSSSGENGSPTWFSSGDKILYCSKQNDSWGIFTMAKDGSDQKQISPSDISLCCPRLSPDGKKIATIRPSRDGSQIFVMDVQGNDLKQITFTVAPGIWDAGFPRDGSSDPRWSPDSKQIAYVSHIDRAPDIFVINADGTENRRLTNAKGRDAFPCWSSDGQYIIFSSGRKSKMQAEIYIMEKDGSKQKALSKYARHDIHPVWIVND